MQAQVKLEASWGEKLVKSVYGGFLTDDEMASLLDGKDYWMEADDVLERLKNKKLVEEQGPTTPKKGAKKRK